jgi:3-deoxy-manno-octulosonate cytidylyltransferase (CMP-KDO synthetase)
MGKPMVIHVYERVKQCQLLDSVKLAIDSEITAEALAQYDVDMVMTASSHMSGSDRIGEVVKDLPAKIVVNIQGDEPMIDPDVIHKLIKIFDDSSVTMATVSSSDLNTFDCIDENTVKVAIDNSGNALSFKRKIENEEINNYLRHVGIYAYRKQQLMDFINLQPTANEKKYRLEQLRALENGIKIKTIVTDYHHRGVDTIEDVQRLNME